MQTHRTTRCAAAGHREFTIQLVADSPLPDLQRVLIEYFEGAVARGSKFTPGQTVQLGWAILKLVDRSDGTIGVQERELTPEVTWTESVDRALRDMWLQREIVASVGLLDQLSFPRQDDAALVAECMHGSTELVMTRVSAEDAPEGFSGW